MMDGGWVMSDLLKLFLAKGLEGLRCCWDDAVVVDPAEAVASSIVFEVTAASPTATPVPSAAQLVIPPIVFLLRLLRRLIRLTILASRSCTVSVMALSGHTVGITTSSAKRTPSGALGDVDPDPPGL